MVESGIHWSGLAPPNSGTHQAQASAGNTLLLSVSRLVVLVPDSPDADAELARRVWLLASPQGLDVLYLAIAGQAADEPYARRQLATLASLTRDARTHVETQVEIARNWLPAVQSVLRSGDLVIACTTIDAAGDSSSAQALESALNVPVYQLPGLARRAPEWRPPLSQRIGSVASATAIVLGFFVLQLRIAQLPRDWTYYALMCLSVLVEAGAIWLWARFWN